MKKGFVVCFTITVFEQPVGIGPLTILVRLKKRALLLEMLALAAMARPASIVGCPNPKPKTRVLGLKFTPKFTLNFKPKAPDPKPSKQLESMASSPAAPPLAELGY